jgi:hypothetical protein
VNEHAAINATTQTAIATKLPIHCFGDSLLATGSSDLPATLASVLLGVGYQVTASGGKSTSYLDVNYWYSAAAPFRHLNAIFWPYRNDVGTLISIPTTAASVRDIFCRWLLADLSHRRFRVIGTLPAAYDGTDGIHPDERTGSPTALARVALNTELAGLFGYRFVDPNPVLAAANNGSTQDLSDVANGWTPTSLRQSGDVVHLTRYGSPDNAGTASGYYVVANAVYQSILTYGW